MKKPDRRLLQELFLWVAAFIGVMVLYFITTPARAQIPKPAQGFRLPLTAFAKAEWGASAPIASFAAQMAQESGFNCAAKSRVGARGCAQFMPATESWIKKVFPSELGSSGSGNPMWDIRALVKYDKWISVRIKADNECERMAFTMSSFNGGLGNAYKRQKLSGRPGICLGATCRINPGIHPSNQIENEHYPRRILLELAPRYKLWGRSAC